jgi:anthranilate/para-aminobenzoate synthase component I
VRRGAAGHKGLRARRYDRRVPTPATMKLRSWPLPVALDVPGAVERLRRRGPVVALESALASADRGGQSLVAGVPLATFTVERGAVRVAALRPGGEVFVGAAELANGAKGAATPFHALEAIVAAARFETRETGASAPPLPAFGWFGYECAAPPELARLASFPDAWFLLTDTVVHWSAPGAAPRLWSADAALGDELAAELAAATGTRAPEASDDAHAARAAASCAQGGDLSLADYSAKFTAARAALARGDSYQLCFTFPIERPFAGDPLALQRKLRSANPAPFAAHVEAPFGAIVSSSPERFLAVDARGRVEARPMKGTAARPADRAARAQAARELVASQKMLAENFMIADLLRNDLGRVCRIGSVRATKAALLEETATLLQLVSVIEGELAPGRTRADLLASAFPPGSMTGAPKTRSVELLRALEAGPRGPYAGALGYWSADGRVDLSVVIRTLLLARGTARVQVGSGIVWDSEVEAEYAECLAKAAAPLAALAACAAGRGGSA